MRRAWARPSRTSTRARPRPRMSVRKVARSRDCFRVVSPCCTGLRRCQLTPTGSPEDVMEPSIEALPELRERYHPRVTADFMVKVLRHGRSVLHRTQDL